MNKCDKCERTITPLEKAYRKEGWTFCEACMVSLRGYVRPDASLGTVPTYRAMMMVAVVLIVSGVVSVGVAGVSLVAMSMPHSGGAVGGVISLAMGGLLLIGMGQIMICVRDIAINSFSHSAPILK